MVTMRVVLLLLTAMLGSRVCFAEQPAPPRPASFAREIVSILTKQGCNSSSCHGGVKGRGGLKLSLDGLDPREDYKWIVQGGTYQVLSPEALPPITPRVSLQEPENSLLLRKPAMQVVHGGGEIFTPESPDYAAILEWVRGGAAYGEDVQKTLQGIEPSSREIVLGPGHTHSLRVVARFAGGRREDVTREVRYESLDSTVATVEPSGVLKALQKGETAVILRWLGQFAHVRIGVTDQEPASDAELPRNNFIDDHVFARLRRFRIRPSELSSDHEFVRRVCLDLAGTLPPPDRVREFLASKDPKKREKVVEALLNSPEYVEFWSLRFADLFRVRGEYGWILPFWEWVRRNVATDKPYHQVAREAIAVQGYGGASHKYQFGINKPPPIEQMVNETIRVFMGRRLDCAQCHNHPFDRWTQNQYWGLGAFFGRMTNTGWAFDNAVFDDPNGHEVDYVENDPTLRFRPVAHPRTKQPLAAMFMDGTALPEDRRDDPRLALANWVVSHPYFAEAAVNRIWGYFFGRGIVDPVDDFRVVNPPTHPELLAALARDFEQHGYSLKQLMRRIVNSRAYQLSSQTHELNRHDRTNYSHALPRPLEAAVLLDAISQVTGVPEVFDKNPAGKRAIQLRFPAGASFLSVFGRPARDAVPDPGGQLNLRQAMHMLAGTTFNAKLSNEAGRLHRLLQSGASDRQLVEEFYLAALSRFPTEREWAGLQKIFAERPRREAAEDLVWALITAREFAENH
ncbi:MAG: DUF1553 domain-containing protein [Acidimicrobiia bacterium]|nr:DUF1553 domain-containing protein [Acidimicrobiia bacterium]